MAGLARGIFSGSVAGVLAAHVDNLSPTRLIAFAVMSAPLILTTVRGTRLRRWRDGD